MHTSCKELKKYQLQIQQVCNVHVCVTMWVHILLYYSLCGACKQYWLDPYNIQYIFYYIVYVSACKDCWLDPYIIASQHQWKEWHSAYLCSTRNNCTFIIILWWITRDYYCLVGLRSLALTNSLLSCARWLWDLKATLTVSRCLLWRHWENLVRTLTDWLHVTVIHMIYAHNLLFRFRWKRGDVGDPSTTDRPQCIFPVH